MEQSYHPQTTDFKTLVTKMKALNPELVFMVSFVTDGAIIVKQAKELGLTPKLFVGNGGGFTMPAFAEKAGDAAENVFSVAPWTPHISFLGAKAFANSYWKRYGTEADYHGAEAFAATLVIADALTRAKEITPEGSQASPDQNRYDDSLRSGEISVLRQEKVAEQAPYLPGPVAKRDLGDGMA